MQRLRHQMVLWGGICLWCICLAAVTSENASARPVANVQFDQGRFTIHQQNVPFLSLLKTISQKASLDIYVVDKQIPQNVSLNISDKPLAETLRMILRGCSYAVVYDAFDPRSMLVSAEQYGDENRVTLLEENAGGKNAARSGVSGSRDRRRQASASSRREAPDRTSPGASRTAYQQQTAASGTSGQSNASSGGGTSAYYQQSSDDGNIADAATGSTGSNASQYASNSYTTSGSSETSEYVRTSDYDDNTNSYTPDTDTGGDDMSNYRCRQYCTERYALEQRIASGESDRYYEKWEAIRGEEYVSHDSERLEYINQQISELSCGGC
ncbi:MAG: hypothetical protein SWH61_13530 [Thermodesulfobacteriota bacterium]|nr:hypothetical protein [Thermodesulfobacteriota bacterium]